MKINLPERANYIIHTLEQAGYEAYAVGGCVRDSLLKRQPEDWDITTSARPRQVKKLFFRTIDVGIEHGTVKVMFGKEGYEVTTYRIDGEYEDSRHPKEVTFTASLKEDLRRRDFTINAMAYNDREGLVDIFGGLADLEAGVIRSVGDAQERFREDALRIMRAVRFSAQLGYGIEKKTKAAMQALAPSLRNISAERVQVELNKLLMSNHPDYLRIAYEEGITAIILPEFDKTMETMQNHLHHKYSVGEHILESMKAVRADRVLRFTMLLHDIAKPLTRSADAKGRDYFKGHALMGEEMAVRILRRLKFDNDTIAMVSCLVRYHDYKIEETSAAVRRIMCKIGKELVSLLFEVKYADIAAQSGYKEKEKLDSLKRLEAIYKEVCKNGDCVSRKELAVTGKDLLEAGMQPGKEMGETLDRLLGLVLENPAHNTKEYLLSQI